MGQENNSNTYKCSHCAAELKPGQMICDYCGQEREGYEHKTYTSDNYKHTSENSYKEDKQEQSTGFARESYGAEYSNGDDKIGALLPYVGKHREYYASKFRKMKSTDKKNSWNWCAFFFIEVWLIYRKMYIEAAIVAIVLTFTESFLLLCVVIILLGIYGNYMYMKHIERLVAREKMLASGHDRENYIDKNKGTSKVAVFVLLLILFFI